MAQIKFKHNQEWRNLEIPLSVLMSAIGGGDSNNGNSNSPVYSMTITNTTNKAKEFPDLSLHMDDISQIELMVWTYIETKSNGNTRVSYSRNYLFAPNICDRVITIETENQAYATSLQTAPSLTTYVRGNNMYALTGALNNLKLKNVDLDEEVDMFFNSNIYIYYKGA